MNIKKFFATLLFITTLPVYGWLYKIANPYNPCSTVPALISLERGVYYMKYLYRDCYYVVKIIIILLRVDIKP